MSTMLWVLSAVLFAVKSEVGSYIEHNITLQEVTGDEIVIHIVGHTHDDPGWLITVDQYYIREVEWIFYTMIPVLQDNPKRKFTYVEMAYMHRWWEEIDSDLKKDTVDLVNNGQFQINLGGWCMNDEASPTASAVIHQMTDGNQFILSNLGLKARPTTAWHVDPFGHSWVTGGMWAQSGFDAFGVHRINYIDLDKRKQNKDLEFIWKGSTSLGEDGYIFFHILDSGYCSPGEINFWDGGSWINTDPLLPSYPTNAIQLGEHLVADARTRSAWFKHNQILIPFGCDFAHQNAYQSMIQMDKLINYINSNATYNATIIYSTLADYISAVNDLKLSWSLEQPDFFTYVDSPHAWWSGYFTSRAYLKLYVRSRANDLRVAEQLYLFAKNMNFKSDYVGGMYNITFLRDAIDVVQHHDAVTGTEKNAVAEEYMHQLSNGTERVDRFDESIIGQFLKGSSGQTPVLKRGNDMISQLTNNNFVVMVAYNSLAWNISEFLQIPTNRSDLVVYDSSKKVVPSQINAVGDQEQNSKYPAKYNLFILAQNMKPLAFETFFIGVATAETPAEIGKRVQLQTGQSFKAGKGYYTITMDGTTNRLAAITNNNLGKTFAVENQFSQYTPSGGIYNDGYIASGAYIFRPATDNRQRLANNNDGKSQNKKQTVTFRQEFKNVKTASPGFIVQTHANTQQYDDTFSVVVCGMDMNKSPPTFDYQYFRPGSDHTWGQQPLFDFVVFDNTDPTYSFLDRLGMHQTGSENVAKSSSSTKSVQITFKTAFSNAPVLLASVRNTQCDGSQFVTSISAVTTTGATVNIRRIDGDNAWNNNVFLDFIAYDMTAVQENELLITGATTVTLSANNRKVTNLTIALDDKNNNFVVNEPVILFSIEQTSPTSNTFYYAMTTYMNNNASFGLNFFPINPSNAGNVQLNIKYIAFERITLFGNVTADANIKNVMITGALMDEVQQTFKSGYGQTYRVFNTLDNDLRFIDNRVQIGPIDQGAEFITKYSTELQSNNEYMTNQAGLEYVKRVYYPYWDERIAANYYPSSGASYIQDMSDNIRFSTIINQGHGVGSLRDGEFECMLQRRCLQDDSRGVAEVLNNTYHTQPQIMIIMDSSETAANLNRRYYQIQQFQHSFWFGLTNTIDSYVQTYNTSWSAMSGGAPLSDSLFLMQLRYAYSGSNVGDNGGMIMAIQNMFETNESSMAKTESVDISNVITPKALRYINSTEMNLLATIPLANMHRLPWTIGSDNEEKVTTFRDEKSEDKRRAMQAMKDRDSNIQIKPREIRTFVLNLDPDVPTDSYIQ